MGRDKTDGISRTIDGHLKTINHSRNRAMLLRKALLDIAGGGVTEPLLTACSAIEIDDDIIDRGPIL